MDDFSLTDFDPVAYINEPRWMESRYGLERIVELLERLGNPQNDLRFVHVAGTNGKGSTCAFLAQVMQAAGYRTGLFTSPYIIEFADRIRIDGLNISSKDLREVTLVVKTAAEAMADHPTEFELMTAVAFLHFARQDCDIVVCEVGLGGRYDSTNVITSPEVCVLTSIAFDHRALLGNTLAEIASEKAGIIKAGVPVVSWPQSAEVVEVIERVASEKGASLYFPDFAELQVHPFAFSSTENPDFGRAHSCSESQEDEPAYDLLERCFDYRTYQNVALRLMGSYQPYNAALAIEAVELLRAGGWSIDDAALRSGLLETQWPGRFEIVDKSPYFVIDGAHNPQGTKALVKSLKEVFPQKKPVLILGLLEDKDYPEMLDDLVGISDSFVIIEPSNPRALPAEKLARAIRLTGQDLLGCSACLETYIAHDTLDAVKCARKIAGEKGLVCACGSLYSVADIKRALI